MTPLAIATSIFIFLGIVAILALAIAALRSKPGFRRRGSRDFDGVDRRATNCYFDSTTEKIPEVANMDGIIVNMNQPKGNK